MSTPWTISQIQKTPSTEVPHFMSTLKSLVSTNYHKYQNCQGTWTLPGVSFVEKASGILLDQS